MKFENNNKEVIKRITKRSLKTNKIRNIFAVLAIVLTTFMISSVFSIGVNFAKNYFTMNTRVDGTDADALLNNPTNDQISKIKSLNICKDIGYEISAGTVEDKKLSDEKKCISLMYCDKVNFEKQITPAISDVSGKYPEKENEIMISTRSLEFLKMKNSKVGDKIKLKVNINKKTEDREFIISGIFTNYDMNTDMGSIFVSNSFIISKGLTLEKNGAVFMSIKSGSITSAEGKFQNSVHLNENQKFQFYYGDSFGETALYVSIVVLIITIFIMLSGYLLIYNVLYIGVTKDINFYGMLKTIGTSPYQIKKIVKGQALKLSVIGIPLGLLLGAAVSFGAVPMVLSMFSDGARKSAMPADISFNPLIFIGAALFSLLTVIISCRKPAKIAGNISPIEALRYTGVTSKKQKKSRNSTKGGKLYKISWYNVFRDKKRAFIVFLSLFMGIITFLSVNTFIDSMKVDNFIARYVPNDFEIENTNGDPDKMSDSMVNTIKNMEGIKDLNIFKVKSMQFEMNKDILGPAIKKSNNSVDKFIKEAESNPKLLQTNVIGVSDEMIEQLYKKNKEKFDVESFKQGKLIILDSWYYGENYKNVKGKITLKDSSGKKITKDVVVIKQDKNHLPEGALDNVGLTPVYISDSELQKFNPDNYAVYINVEDKYEPQIKSQLKTMTKKYNLNFEAKTDQIKEFNNTNMVEKILGGGVSLILVFIGILNFINIMVTGIDTRLHELAVMESIGMTKKQIKKMLMFEGTYYAAITSFITCTLGTAIIYGISLLARKAADYAVFSFPTVQIVSIIICIFIICIITPVIVFKYSSKRSITERIRETEN